jgi:hypothetical protein
MSYISQRIGALLLCFGLQIIANSPAMAHGAVSMDKDMCKLTIGGYLMHFTGYQPATSRSEFCEDIPQTGRTVIVFDFIDDPLRDLTIEIHLLKMKDGSMDNASVVYRIPPKKYPTGSVSIDYAFAEAGDYVGMVMVVDEPKIVANFPFSVGRDRTMLYVAAGTTGLLGAAIVLFIWSNARRRAEVAAVIKELQ